MEAATTDCIENAARKYGICGVRLHRGKIKTINGKRIPKGIQKKILEEAQRLLEAQRQRK